MQENAGCGQLTRRSGGLSTIDIAGAHRGLKVDDVVHYRRIGRARRYAYGDRYPGRPVVALGFAKKLEFKILHRHRVAGDGIGTLHSPRCQICRGALHERARERLPRRRQLVNNMIASGIIKIECVTRPGTARRARDRRIHAAAVRKRIGRLRIRNTGSWAGIPRRTAEKISRTDRARHLLERQADVALRRDERGNLALGANSVRKTADRDRNDDSEQPNGHKHFNESKSFFHHSGCQS